MRKEIHRNTVKIFRNNLRKKPIQHISMYITIFQHISILLFLLATLILICLILPQTVQADTTNQISQFGITWTFDKEYEYGQFANGDYWVVGPVTITNVSPGWDGTRHGSMINPIPTGQQAYDSRIGGFNSALVVQFPMTLNPNTSLVSAISYIDCSEPGAPPACLQGLLRPVLKTAAVLTVLDSIPLDNGATVFRPPYSGNTKSLYLTSSLRKDLLPNLPIVANPPNINNIAGRFERIWLDHFASNSATPQYTSPYLNMPNYGREYSTLVGDASLLLMIDEQQLINQFGSNKDTLLIRLVQLGIDLYASVENGNYWRSGGGTNTGKKWPILFAGIMLDHPGMKNIGILSRTMPYDGFQEDCATFYVTQEVVDLTNSPQWNPDAREWCEVLPYAQEDIGLPEWSIKHCSEPSMDNKAWGACYRHGEQSDTWKGFILAAHIMGAKDLWNHDAIFDYIDRHEEIDGPGTSFAGSMWNAYRANYDCIWTRHNPNDIYSNGYNPCTSTPPALKGDINKDGKVNIQDVQACVNHISGTQDWGSEADVNSDGSVDGIDVNYIIKVIFEK